MEFKFLLFFALTACASSSILNNQKCKNRRTDYTINGVNYFFSGFLDDQFDKKPVSWSKARDICKSYCSDLMSIDTQQEFEKMNKFLLDNSIDYLWTSGHVCERNQCDEKSQPININGWMWLDKNKKMPPTNKAPPGWSFNPWSQTGFRKVPQPDNAEFGIANRNESCLAILHNVYNDGIKFHDVACYHKKNFICEG